MRYARKIGVGLFIVAGVVLAGCGRDDPEPAAEPSTSSTPVAVAPTTTKASATTMAPATTVVAASYDGPDAAITVVTDDWALHLVSPADGSLLDEILPAPGEDGQHARTLGVDLDGRVYVTLAHEAASDCDHRVHRITDGGLEEVFVGSAPAFSPDGRWVAYLDDGYARAGQDRPLAYCVRDTVVVRDLESGAERTWRRTPDDETATDPDLLDSFYTLEGTPGALDWSPDSATLSLMVFGEGFASFTADATTDELLPEALEVSPEVRTELDAALPTGWGLSTAGWADDGSLAVVAFGYEAAGWAEARVVDGEVVEVTSTSAEPVPSLPLGERDGHELIIDRSGDTGVLTIVSPAGDVHVVTDGVFRARW